MHYDPFERSPEQIASEKQVDRRAVVHVRDFVLKSSEYRKEFLRRARLAREDYTIWQRRSRSLIQRANLMLPYAYQIVEQEKPQIVAPFLRENPPFKLLGQEPKDMEYECDLTDFLGAQLRQMELRRKYVSHVDGNVVEGTSIAKIPYRFTEKNMITRKTYQDPETGEPFQMEDMGLETTYDGPDFEDIPLADFFPDWTVREAGEIQKMRGCVHRVYKTYEEIHRNRMQKNDDGTTRGVYKNIDELKYSVHTKGCKASAKPYWDESWNGSLPYQETKKEFKKPIELWEYWGMFDRKDGTFEEFVITIANGDICIRLERNPYNYQFKPFIADVNVAVKNEWYGISELFAVRGLIKEAIALRNSRLDATNLKIHPMWKVLRTGGVNTNALVARPGGTVFVNQMDAVDALHSPDVPQSAYRELTELASEVQSVAGSNAGPNLSQAGKVFGRSATGASFVAGIAGSRAAVKIHAQAEMFWKPLVSLMMMINAQYVDDEVWVRVQDTPENPFRLLPSSAFHIGYDFEVKTSVTLDPNEEMEKMQIGMQLFQTVEGSQPNRIKFDVVFEEFGRLLFGRKVRKFTRTDEEMAEIQQQQLMMEQAANAARGANVMQPNAQPGPMRR